MKIESRVTTQLPEIPKQTERSDVYSNNHASTTPPLPWLKPFQEPLFGIGLVMLVLSAGAFLLYDLLNDSGRTGTYNSLMIMLHYGLFIIYGLMLWTSGYLKIRDTSRHRPVRWLGLLLWLISAYALNRDLPVFQQSTEWLCWALTLVGIAMTGYAWLDMLSVRIQQLLYAVLAFGFWVFAYMAVYMVEWYIVSVPLLIGLGLSCHTFVPLAFTITLGRRLWYDCRHNEHLRPGVVLGAAIPVVALVIFLTGWVSDLNRIDRIRRESTIRQTSDLPEWVLIAQQLKPDWITNRLLLAGQLYDLGPFFSNSSGFFPSQTGLDDARQHDPLVVIASNLYPTDGLTASDKLRLLKTIHDERHITEEKFWTGRHLAISDVVSQVRIWPQFRLSYTEKTIRIHNRASITTEEALLTFHLPSGSVVSSMSLWVNGREEPARLTTVAKADSVYRTIVGVESRISARDPSVVFWQEGNRVTIRVFPCRANEDRRVKLGITSPLAVAGNELVYQNAYFEGPNAISATELINIDFDQTPQSLESPWLLDKLTGNQLTHQGSYEPNWSLRFKAPALSPDAFVMPDSNLAYQLIPYKPTWDSFVPTDVYLDVNAAWTKDEFIAVFNAATQIKSHVWLFDDGLKQLTKQDLEATYNRLSAQQFSLFPVYRIQKPATALLITKATLSSPTLSDLKNTVFAERMQQTGRQTEPIRTFCLGNTLSPYLKTLSELSVLNVTSGAISDLSHQVIAQHQFPKQLNEPGQIALPEAGVNIQEITRPEPTATILRKSSAPDHLARLFAYNHLLHQIGRHYFTPNYQTDTLIHEAQMAHVVSPLSSLIVLETANDYERFGIKKDRSGLENATLKQEGAVPEPHEWALLAMLAGFIGWLIWKKRYATA
ncbi:XrtN system VIT domain-containing protein [Spirosoma aureum]|uniref:XrtN system VIT domain-containing protein n=1 Tax=Spirosoma aureum TaxID=2692134 RepID=A0A6G9AVS4_9BACT|nr:XrtN system VIT domain-containing protein [Spirosoma aureum]QIP16454.1 XrtN system VIT domain-containing protein [Spirosoma aureum]